MARPRLVLAWLLLSFSAAGARAETLAFRAYSSLNGLASDGVTALLEDRRGFLWISTSSGLSRFDGSTFRSYGAPDGLPHPAVYPLVEDRAGALWAGTGDGLVRLRQGAVAAGPLFDVVRFSGDAQASFVHSLFADRAGRLWVGAGQRLYVHAPGRAWGDFREVDLGLPFPRITPMEVGGLAEGADGSLWIGTYYGLLRRLPSGRSIFYRLTGDPRTERVQGLAVDGDGRVWVLGKNVFVLMPEPADAPPPRRPLAERAAAASLAPGPLALPRRPGEVLRLSPPPLASREPYFHALSRGSRAVFLGTTEDLWRIADGRLERLGAEQGLGTFPVSAVLEDHAGNLWIGSNGRGLSRLAPGGVVRYSTADGLTANAVSAIFAGEAGETLVVSPSQGSPLHRFAHGRFRAFAPRAPGHPEGIAAGWGTQQTAARAPDGEWWIATGFGLLRYPAVPLERLPRTPPLAIYGEKDGINAEVFRIYIDRAGDVWVAGFPQWTLRPHRPAEEVVLSCFRRALGRFEHFRLADGLPPSCPSAFAEDAAGDLWIGFYNGGLARLRGGRLRFFSLQQGAPGIFEHALHTDRRGRLWVASSRDGVTRIDDPAAAEPRFTRMTTRDGLASDTVLTIVEDDLGRLYFGSIRGVDRYDPRSGRTVRFTVGEGLPQGPIVTAYRAVDGALWFGTAMGLARLDPRTAQRPGAPPRILLSGLAVDGVPRLAGEPGVAATPPLTLAPGIHSLDISFLGVDLDAGDQLRYRFRLLGLRPEWSPPSAERHLRYDALPPGHYRFEVVAVAPGGAASREPAAVELEVEPPLWRRPWFVALLAATLAAAAYGAHRARLVRALALERVRTRIATDLHDEMGSSLARISILSAVAQRQLQPAVHGVERVEQVLAEIGDGAHQLMESMGDIVWSIDPKQDSLLGLTLRLRRFGEDLLGGHGVQFALTAPDGAERIHLAPDVRRNLWLLLKEVLHNVVKHSRATRVEIALERHGHRLRVRAEDDGIGFDRAAVSGCGLGLRSLERRAAELGGSLEIASEPGGGTRIQVDLPLA